VYKIITYPIPVLRTRARRSVKIDDELQILIEEMTENHVCRRWRGTGCQSGRVFQTAHCCGCGKGSYGPDQPGFNRSRRREGRYNGGGVPQLPGIRVDVTRPDRVHLTALDPDGNPVDMIADGLLARVLQHETIISMEN